MRKPNSIQSGALTSFGGGRGRKLPVTAHFSLHSALKELFDPPPPEDR